jgi:ankyrin repeat protein
MKPNRIRFCIGSCLGIFVCLLFCQSNFNSSAQTQPDNGTVETFFNAITENDTNTFSKMLAGDTNLTLALYYGRLPLTVAASKGQAEMVAQLLKRGADINVRNDTLDTSNVRLTALDAAIWYDHPDVCKLLLEAGADPNIQSTFDGSASHYAFTYRRAEMAGWLLDYGANPFLEKANPYNKVTPLEMAITQGDGKLVPRMLGQDRQHPIGTKSLAKKTTPPDRLRQPVKTPADILAERGAPMLAAAAQRGELEAVQALLKAGVSAKTNSEGNLPLLQAFALSEAEAAKARLSAIEQLQQTRDRLNGFGTNVNPQFLASFRSQEADMATRVESLAPERWQQILTLLIKNGADYDVFAATALGDTNQMRLLLGANKNVIQSRDLDGETPLYWAVKTDQLLLTAFWLGSGASPSVTNLAGQTPLHVAAGKNLVEHMKLLLAAHAPTDVRDTNGWTPLDTAEHSQNTEAIQLLLSDKSVAPPSNRAVATSVHDAATGGNIGALAALTETTNNLEARNELGLTPLQVAVLNGHFAEAALLVDRGANVNVRDPDGNTLLHQILLQERNFYVRDRPPTSWLDRMEDDPRKDTYAKYLTVGQNEQGPNPVLQAASFLLACGVDAKATNRAGQTAVQLVTEGKTSRYIFFFNDDQAALLKLISSGGGNINETDANGDTELDKVVVGDDAMYGEKVAALIASAADVNATNHQGRTALHIAVEKINEWPDVGGPNNAVLALLNAKANVNVQDNDGLTPLHILATSDSAFQSQASKALLDAGANPNLQDHQGRTPLLLIAGSQQAFTEGIVHNLLDAGANPNLQDKHGRTPAHLFLSGSWPWSSARACLPELAKAKADFSIKDEQGKTPLHYLAALGEDSSLFFISGVDDIFVAAKVDFNARDNDGNTPLIIAAKTGTRDVFDWLAKHGASLDATNNQGETARLLAAHSNNSSAHFGPAGAETDIFQAAREGNMDAATRLLNADPLLVNHTNQFQQTPLRVAVMQHQTNMIGFLETHGAKWDEVSAVMAGRANALQKILAQTTSAISSTVSGKGLAHIAAANGDVQSLKILIAANCDLQAQDSWGLSPLGYALIKKRADEIQLLLQHGAKENFFDAVYADDLKTSSTLLAQDKSLAKSQNKINASAVEIAAAAGYGDILKLLLKNGASVDAADSIYERNPLHLAAFHNQTNNLEILIRAGADINLADRQGFTPLHWATMQDATEAAALLLKNKADPNSHIAQPVSAPGPGFMMGLGLSVVGDTPLHLAAWAGRTNVIQLLLKSKADVNAMNVRSQTPLDLTSMPPILFFTMQQRDMVDLIEPLRVRQTPTNPFLAGRETQQVAAALINAAGGKHSPNNPNLRRMPGPNFPN